jgi:phospholipid/cholesterol/gamma-HCH transport system ATP-binding protein
VQRVHGAERQRFWLLSKCPERYAGVWQRAPAVTTVREVSGIVLRNAWFGFQEQPVLRGAELVLEKGRTVVVTGANGCGKSTLLYACAGLVRLSRGSIELGGRRAGEARPGELFRAGIRCGFVFQEGGLLANMNALANVALALRYHADTLGLTLEEIDARATAALERVRIRKSDYYLLPAHLSFGVRKRLALARAIALQPNFFFFDDPDVGLDPDTARLIHEILCGYRDDPEVTTLVATNRDLLIDRLGVPGYELHEGVLGARSRKLA